MPLISVLTAAYAPNSAYLPETIASVVAQELPDGWEMEWIVQEDGVSPSLADEFSSDRRVRYDSHESQLGIAATRNLALARASGTLVRVIDGDDVLLPGALASLIPRFDQENIHWAAGQADDLMPNGERTAWQAVIPFGVVPAGVVNRQAAKNDGNWRIHCAGLVVRTSSVRAIGGWYGLPTDDDLIMFAALSEMADGYNDPQTTWLYRQHPGQETRNALWRSRSEKSRQIALQRAASVRASGLSFTKDARKVQSGQDPATAYRVGPAEKDSGSSLNWPESS